MDPAMTGTPPRRRARNWPLILMIGGALAAIGGYVTMNTQLVLAYRGGTLANVHSLCSNAFVQALAHGSSACSSISADYTLASVALWGGLALAGIGLAVFLMQRRAA